MALVETGYVYLINIYTGPSSLPREQALHYTL